MPRFLTQTRSAALGITFDDETTFNLSANANITVDEFIYQEGGKNNSALFKIARGTVVFFEAPHRIEATLHGVRREVGDCQTPFQGLARSVMEDNLSQLEQEFLGVGPGATALEVIRKMKEAHVGCALVLDDGRLVGIFTERDILKKLVGKNAVTESTAVKDLMSVNPETLQESDSVATALNKMSMGRYRHIPIQKFDGSYAVTSIKHVLKYIAKEDW